jgi:Ca2+-transporting ATPase
MNVSTFQKPKNNKLKKQLKHWPKMVIRVLGVGEAIFNENNYPTTQQEFKFTFEGIVAFTILRKKTFRMF